MPKPLYREVFRNRHTFLPVIHVRDAAQADRNTYVAFQEGADGVFLINHDITAVELLKCYAYVRERHIGAWIGLNLLGLDRSTALQVLDNTVSGLWVDDGGINENLEEPQFFARKFYQEELERHRTFIGLYFGGVEFKGKKPAKDPGRMAKLAAPYMDVVTTSGDKTGSPPTVEKLEAMRKAIPDDVFANASGETPENVGVLKPYLDCHLVSTWVSKDFYNLDPQKLRAFRKELDKHD